MASGFSLTAKTLDSRVEHGVGINPFQSKTMPGLLGKRRHKGQLGPAVAFAERMDGVQIGKKVRRLFSESLRVPSGSVPDREVLAALVPERVLPFASGGSRKRGPSRAEE